MDAQVKFTLLSPRNGEIDALRQCLGAPNNRSLFPSHFLKATFSRLGGRMVGAEAGGNLVGVGFLFPRGVEGRSRCYTLRFHRIGEGVLDEAAVVGGVEALLDDSDRVVFYDACVAQRYEVSYREFEGVEVGTPSADEALAIPQLQRAIWGGDLDSLYPADVYSTDFHAGTSLVARCDGMLVGFLVGFYRFGGIPQLPDVWKSIGGRGDFRLESQLLGVLRSHRGSNIGFLLKRVQAERAQSEGIGVVHWTVDPLQFANARLNFGRLGAVAADFYRDYYSFRNELNRVSASRLGITWLINSERVSDALAGERGGGVVDLAGNGAIRRFDGGIGGVELHPGDGVVAIEVPGDWTALQRVDLGSAVRWRGATDRFFERYLGWEVGQYMITGVGVDGVRRYLIAERVSKGMLEGLV